MNANTYPHLTWLGTTNKINALLQDEKPRLIEAHIDKLMWNIFNFKIVVVPFIT